MKNILVLILSVVSFSSLAVTSGGKNKGRLL